MNFQTEKDFQDYFGIQQVEKIKRHVRTTVDHRTFGMNNSDLYDLIPVEYEYTYKLSVNEDFINLLELLIRKERSDRKFYDMGFYSYEQHRTPISLVDMYQKLRTEYESQEEDRRMQQKHAELAEIMKDYKSMKALLTSQR